MAKDSVDLANSLMRRHLEVSEAIRNEGMGKCIQQIEKLVEDIDRAFLAEVVKGYDAYTLTNLAFQWRYSLVAYRTPSIMSDSTRTYSTKTPVSMILRLMSTKQLWEVIIAITLTLSILVSSVYFIGRWHERVWKLGPRIRELESEKQKLSLNLQSEMGNSCIFENRLKLSQEKFEEEKKKAKDSSLRVEGLERKNQLLRLLIQLNGRPESLGLTSLDSIRKSLNDLLVEMTTKGDVTVRRDNTTGVMYVRFVSSQDEWVLPNF